MQTARNALYPNIYTLLVAPPAVGKSQAISPVLDFWVGTKKLKVAPDNMTKASLIDSLAKSERNMLLPGSGGLLEQHPMVVAQGELGVLMPGHDLEFISVINHMFDCPRSYREERRTLNRSIDITNPQVNMLLGTQPKFLASTLPEEAWGMGFCSRIIMVYAGVSPTVDIFDSLGLDVDSKNQLQLQLNRVCDMMGVATFTQDALARFREWHLGGMEPMPEHSRLEHYIGRRHLYVLKLSVISAASRLSALPMVPPGGISVTLDDLTRAMNWLFQAESLMPDIFRDMTGKSDQQVIQDLHFTLWGKWAAGPTKGKPIPEALLYAFLARHVPSDKVGRVVEIAERAGYIQRVAGTGAEGRPALYIPQPRNKHAPE